MYWFKLYFKILSSTTDKIYKNKLGERKYVSNNKKLRNTYM